jgi:hypothetical protein
MAKSLLAALALVTGHAFLAEADMQEIDWAAWLLLVSIGLFSEALATEFPIAGQARSSMAFLPFIAIILVFPTLPAIAAIGLVVAVASALLRKQSWERIAFNTSSAIVASSAGAASYSLVGSIDVPWNEVAAFGVLAATFFTLNMCLASAALSLMKGDRFVTVFRSVAGPRGANLSYDLLASPIAWVMVLGYTAGGIAGLLVVSLPLMLLRRSYQAQVNFVKFILYFFPYILMACQVQLKCSFSEGFDML